MKKVFTILLLLTGLDQVSAQKQVDLLALAEIENLYQSKDEEGALLKVQKYKEDHTRDSGFDLLPFLRWEVRIYYELWDTERATELLERMMEIDPDLDYEQFPDKQEHFRTFFEKVEEEHTPDVVFVNKFKENVELTPAVITVYKEEEIKRLGARNLMDLVRITPGFAEIGDNNERNFGTRGIYGTTVQHVLVLINGHRINDLLTSSADPGWVTLDYVQQVEFMRGPGSALYGGNAFSGVINIITKSAKVMKGSRVSVTSGSSQLFDGGLSDHVYRLNFQHGALMNERNRLYFSGTVGYDGGTKYTYSRDQSAPGEVFPDIRAGSQDTIPPNTEGTEYINRYLPGYNFLINYETREFNLTANAQRSQFVINRPNSGNLWNEDQTDNRFVERKRIDSREFISLDYSLFTNKITNGALDLKTSFDHFYKSLPVQQYANFDPSPQDSSKT
ncbi:MAG: TonB-dependent receptor plug domain-containing protein, partial [Bacteroidota bacterium]